MILYAYKTRVKAKFHYASQVADGFAACFRPAFDRHTQVCDLDSVMEFDLKYASTCVSKIVCAYCTRELGV